MSLTTQLGIASHQTIEFAGVGPPGKKRTIAKFDYVTQGAIRRVNVVANPAQDWVQLFSDWVFLPQSQHVILTIRTGNVALLTMNDVLPLHFSVQLLDVSSSSMPLALLCFGSQQVAVTRAQPVAISALDKYLPVAVRNGTPSDSVRPRGGVRGRT